MISKKAKLSLFITAVVSVAFSLVVCIPFHTSTVSKFELVFKFIIAPIIVLLAYIANTIIKYLLNRSDIKFVTVASYAPLFGYIASASAMTGTVLVRSQQGFTSFDHWMITLFVVLVILILDTILSHFVYRAVLSMKKVNNIILDAVFGVVTLAVFITYYNICAKYLGLTFEIKSPWVVVFCIIISLLVIGFLTLRGIYLMNTEEMYKKVSKKQLLERWHKGREAVYNQAELDILYNLYEFSKNELGIVEDFGFDDDEDEQYEEDTTSEEANNTIEATPIEEQPVVEEEIKVAPVQKQIRKVIVPKERQIVESVEVIEEPVVEVVKDFVELENPEIKDVDAELENVNEEYDVIMSQLVLMEAEKAALLTGLDAETTPAPKPQREPKNFKPSFSELVGYAKSLDGATYTANKELTNYRFSYNRKPFLVLMDTPSKYIIRFIIELENVAKYAISTPSFTKAKSPKGDNWFQVVSKGDISEELLFEIIDQSLEAIKSLIQKDLDAKEAARREKVEKAARERLEAKLAAMTPEKRAEWEAREQRKAEKARAEAMEHARLAAMTPEELAAEIKARAEEEAAKVAEQERIAREKAEAREKAQEERARLAREKAEARERALAEKEAEKARLAREKEEAREKALAEKEAEKARLAREKEEAREKALAEKEAEKARLAREKDEAREKALAEKEAEKTRLAREKEEAREKALAEKEAEKARLQKEKEAEKIRLQKEKEKEAAKQKVQKEKEAAKLKAQKEKEAEKARLQKEKEREAAKLKAQKEKEAEKARLQKEKEAAKLKAQKEREKEAARVKALKEKEAAKALKEKETEKARLEKEKEAAKLKAQKESEKAKQTSTDEELVMPEESVEKAA